MERKTKIKIGLCCFILPAPIVGAYELIRRHRAKKNKKVIEKGTDNKTSSKLLNLEFFTKFSKNTLNEARLKLNKEVSSALAELKKNTFDKIYELQKQPMRDEERDTLVKEFLQNEIKEDAILKNYIEDGVINADFIAMHPNLLKEKALSVFNKFTVKGYLLYNEDIYNPNFSIKPMAYNNIVYITKDTKELFLLGKTIGNYLGKPMWYTVRGFPFSMEMEHGVEQIEKEFEGIMNIDKRFVLKRKGISSNDIEKKFKSIELQKELGYTFPLVRTMGIIVITALMSAIVTSMFWMMTLL